MKTWQATKEFSMILTPPPHPTIVIRFSMILKTLLNITSLVHFTRVRLIYKQQKQKNVKTWEPDIRTSRIFIFLGFKALEDKSMCRTDNLTSQENLLP